MSLEDLERLNTSDSLARLALEGQGLLDLLDKKRLAGKLSCSIRTVDNLVARRAIPYLKIGRLVRFRLEDVKRTLAKKYTVQEVSI